MLSISVNQQGERLGTYKSIGADKYEPATFNIVMVKAGAGNEAGEVVKCELEK